MFDKLFRSQTVVQRHLNSPLQQARLEYLQYCAKQGYRLITLRGLAADLLLIQNLLGLAASSDSLGVPPENSVQPRWNLNPTATARNGSPGMERTLSQRRSSCLLFQIIGVGRGRDTSCLVPPARIRTG